MLVWARMTQGAAEHRLARALSRVSIQPPPPNSSGLVARVCYQSRCPGLYGYHWVVLTEVLDAYADRLDARIDADQPGAELPESGQQEPALLAK